MTDSNIKTFDSLANLATKQRELYQDAPKQKLLEKIENALLKRQLPALASVTIEPDVSDTLLNELLRNHKLMKELKLYLTCRLCANTARTVTISCLSDSVSASIHRVCSDCYLKQLRKDAETFYDSYKSN